MPWNFSYINEDYFQLLRSSYFFEFSDNIISLIYKL